MDFTELYAQKKMTAAQAAALVKSGDWVDYGWAVNTPVAVDAEIAKRLPELEGVNFRGGILMWVPAIFQIDDPAAHMTWNSWHMGGIERKAIAQGFFLTSTHARIPAAARKETAATSWLTRMPVENRYRLSVRSPSIQTRPRPYHAT